MIITRWETSLQINAPAGMKTRNPEHGEHNEKEVWGTEACMSQNVCINKVAHILARIITCSAISCIFLKGLRTGITVRVRV